MPDLTQFFGEAPFDPSSVEPQDDFTFIKPGKYSVLIEKAEVKITSKLTGHLISLQMQVLNEGPFKGRKVFDNINIQNPSTQCVEIGLRSLSALAQAIGLPAVNNTDELLNKVVVAHVKVKDEQNSVRTYSAAGDGMPVPNLHQPALIAAPAPAQPAPVAPPAAAPVAPTYIGPGQPVSPPTPNSVAEPTGTTTQAPAPAPVPLPGPPQEPLQRAVVAPVAVPAPATAPQKPIWER